MMENLTKSDFDISEQEEKLWNESTRAHSLQNKSVVFFSVLWHDILEKVSVNW